jgi:hypothetical protein
MAKKAAQKTKRKFGHGNQPKIPGLELPEKGAVVFVEKRKDSEHLPAQNGQAPS